MEDALAPSTFNPLNALEPGLNPCCNGRCTRTYSLQSVCNENLQVLILVVMEDALAQPKVLRLSKVKNCLNPCCNGRCTRTD